MHGSRQEEKKNQHDLGTEEIPSVIIITAAVVSQSCSHHRTKWEAGQLRYSLKASCLSKLGPPGYNNSDVWSRHIHRAQDVPSDADVIGRQGEIFPLVD
jgi:hypothetical protein